MSCFGKTRPRALVACSLFVLLQGIARAEELFEIRQIEVDGATLLSAYQVREIVTPFIGKDKGFRDIQMTLEAIENAYRLAGYTAVQVITPEQELTAGVLRLEVRETPIATVTVAGNKHFSAENIRATLPSLQEGRTPNARMLSENVQLANENPAKQIDVVLSVSQKDPNALDATINVEDEAPFRGFVRGDNTGTSITGRHRLGVALRHSNLWDSDHTATFAYTTSPDKPEDTKVDIYSLGYRIPFYGIGDSLDLFYARSNINTPASSFTLGAFENITGRGEIWGIRWNHYFQRRGEWSTKLVGGVDLKAVETGCTGPNGERKYLKGQTAGCTPYTTRPLTLTYSGNWQRPGQAADFSLGGLYNVATGKNFEYTAIDGDTGNDRYSLVSSSRKVRDNFTILKYSGSYSHNLPGNWLARIAGSGQSSLGRAIPPSEQFGLSGTQAVRGFHERVVSADAGHVLNFELYAPDVAPSLSLPGTLRPLVFFDTARGHSYKMKSRHSKRTETEPSGISSAGIGLRYNYKKDVFINFDLASVLDPGPMQRATDYTKTYEGDWQGHFNVTVGF